MDKYFLCFKGFFTAMIALIANELGIICPAMILLIILMITDYISGMLAAKREVIEHPDEPEYGWSSKKSIIGIYKKVGYMLTILVAISTDYVIFKLIAAIGIEYQTNTLFGLLVVIWFVLNELLSILENAGRMGVALPLFLVKVLKDVRKNIDNTP